MIEAFAASYRLNVDIGLNSVPKMAQELAVYIGSLSTLAMQIAAPVAATAFVVDAAMGIVNKAVPQMQVYVVTLPAKIAAGMLALAYGLPLLTQGVDAGMEMAVTSMDRMLTSGKP
jgi:flagellar biosynthetic protein FliR